MDDLLPFALLAGLGYFLWSKSQGTGTVPIPDGGSGSGTVNADVIKDKGYYIYDGSENKYVLISATTAPTTFDPSRAYFQYQASTGAMKPYTPISPVQPPSPPVNDGGVTGETSAYDQLRLYNGLNYTDYYTAITGNHPGPFGQPIRSLKTYQQVWQVFSGPSFTGNSVIINKRDYPDATSILAPINGIINSAKRIG